MNRGDLEAAEVYSLRGLTITEQLAPGRERVAIDLTDLGIIAGQRINLVEVERSLRRAIDIEEKASLGSQTLGTTLGILGNVVFERGDLAKAEEYYLKQLSIANPGSSFVAAPLNNLGNVALEGGDLVKAEDYYRRALALFEKIKHGGRRGSKSLKNLRTFFPGAAHFAQAPRFC